MKSSLLVSFILLVSLVSLAQDKPAAGPFGFERGMTREQITQLVGKGTPSAKNPRVVLTVTSAPNPNPAFEKYVLFISPTQGLLKVVAVGVTIQTGDTGSELQSGFSAIVSGVSQKYGKPSNTFDSCNGGTGCSDSAYWMLSLMEKNRTLEAFWEMKDRPPVNFVTMISLETNPLSLNTGYFSLGFEFEGWNQFVDSEQAKQNNSY